LFTPPPPPPIATTLSKGDQLMKRLNVIFGLQSALLPGYTAAVAASVFVGPLKGLEKEFEKVGKLRHVKVQLIWVSTALSYTGRSYNLWIFHS
jgi:hypothetical protein